MKQDPRFPDAPPELMHAARYAATYRGRERPLDPAASLSELRDRFCRPLPAHGRDGIDVIRDLIDATEPGLVGNTNPGFLAWVMGGSHPTGVAADWLTSIWGQNAAIYQCAPAAAIAEEAAGAWILDLLGLPEGASVGFTTGATMAGFVGLAAARGEVLRRAGFDVTQTGLAGAPPIAVYMGEEAHATNLSALRYLGIGEAQIVRIPADQQGLIKVDHLADAMRGPTKPRIVICQAGHINTGGCDDFDAIADLCAEHGAWMHVDGAFGLWAQVSPRLRHLTRGVDRADSWSVDGHKWLQVPYDSGFAIVRHPEAHRRAMDVTAGYLNASLADGRNPTEYNPELSRRARGFAVWAVLQSLGRRGVAQLVERHCAAARALADRLRDCPGITVLNEVTLNQVVIGFGAEDDPRSDYHAVEVARKLNAPGTYFLRTAEWRKRTVLRISITEDDTGKDMIARFADDLIGTWSELAPSASRGMLPRDVRARHTPPGRAGDVQASVPR